MTAVPESMRAAVLHGVGDIRVEERAVPRPGAGEVLVRIRAVGTCGSDTHYFEQGRIGDFVVREPLVLGHEPSGEIVATGPDVPGDRLGQRVSIEPGRPCRACAQCLGGRYNLCPRMRFYATPPVDGAFCDYVIAHEAFAHPVPPGLSDEAAALLEPLSVGVWACRKGRISPGTTVLVTGAGPIGLVTIQVALAFGATAVIATDVNPARLELAARFGATETIDVGRTPLDETAILPDVLLECSGSAPAIGGAVRRVREGGRVVLVGMGGEDVPLPLAHVQRNELEVTGTFRYAGTWPTATALASSGSVLLDPLVTHRFDLDTAADALTVGRRDPSAVKAVVRPDHLPSCP